MAKRHSSAKEVAKRTVENGYWIDHARIEETDFDWLNRAGRLTLWNVRIPDGFLARLENLWWLDIRGGSATDLEAFRGLAGLKYLAVSHVRGLSNLTILPEMLELQFFSLYALPKITILPSLKALSKLERVEIGLMKGLESLGGLLHAPALKDIVLVKRVNVTEQDIQNIKSHKTIKSFTWYTEDVPVKMFEQVVERINLPESHIRSPESWFGIPVY